VTEHAVVIAGGGPTGMMLGGELALAGIDVAVVERRESQVLEGSRSRGLHSPGLMPPIGHRVDISMSAFAPALGDEADMIG